MEARRFEAFQSNFELAAKVPGSPLAVGAVIEGALQSTNLVSQLSMLL